MTTFDPLAGPFIPSSRLLDYSGQPGYAKRAPDAPDAPEGVRVEAVVLARLDRKG